MYKIEQICSYKTAIMHALERIKNIKEVYFLGLVVPDGHYFENICLFWLNTSHYEIKNIILLAKIITKFKLEVQTYKFKSNQIMVIRRLQLQLCLLKMQC